MKIMRSTYSFVASARPARTSREEDVTPPLFALESLKRITLRFSRKRRACCVRKRFAPSTMNLKCGLPSESTSAAAFEMLTASGLVR